MVLGTNIEILRKLAVLEFVFNGNKIFELFKEPLVNESDVVNLFYCNASLESLIYAEDSSVIANAESVINRCV